MCNPGMLNPIKSMRFKAMLWCVAECPYYLVIYIAKCPYYVVLLCVNSPCYLVLYIYAKCSFTLYATCQAFNFISEYLLGLAMCRYQGESNTDSFQGTLQGCAVKYNPRLLIVQGFLP